jgi:lipopolysaccharide exporter
MGIEGSDLGKRMAKGAIWTVMMRFVVRSIGIVSTVVLARLLVPADFGLVALATMLVALLELFSEFEFGTFLILEQGTDRSHYDTAWTLSVARGGVTAVLLVISAPIAAEFFAEPRLQNVVYAFALASFADGFSNIGVVDFQKSLTFDRDFRLMVQIKLVSFTTTILFAALLRDYWALVIGTLSGRFARIVFSYMMHPYRPKLSLARTGDIIHFSKWLLANKLFYYAQRRSYALVIGKYLDSASLGLYSLAREVSALATSELLAPINRALLPGLSKLAREPEALRRAFLDGLSMIVMLALPLAAGVGVTADPLVRAAMGPKWVEAIPVMQILAIVGLTRVCISNSDAYFLALNRPHLTTVLACFGAVVGILSLLWATANWGLIGAAWATSATAALQMLLNYAIIWRMAGISPAAVGSVIWRSVAACLIMAGVVQLLLEYWPQSDALLGLLLKLLGAFVLGAITYIAAHVALWRISGAPPSAEQHALVVVMGLLARFGLRRAVGRI